MNPPTGGDVRNVVLVHGAYADGSSWSEVITRLQAAGLTATAVQNPLGSLADDVAHTRRILAMQGGPTILAGHSFAGTVITEAGIDPRVVGLVYVAARAPDAGEDYAALTKTFPTPPANAGLVYENGYGGLTEHAFLNDFANGVDPVKARALYAVQGRVSEALFTERVTVAAWRSKPCWYAVSQQDRTTRRNSRFPPLPPPTPGFTTEPPTPRQCIWLTRGVRVQLSEVRAGQNC